MRRLDAVLHGCPPGSPGRGARRTVFFAHAGAIGSQSQSTGRFPGDQQRSWDPGRGLPSVLQAMINGSLAGWPYAGPDIAGFTTAPDDVTDERELWLP